MARDIQRWFVVAHPQGSHVQLTENRSRLALMPKLEDTRRSSDLVRGKDANIDRLWDNGGPLTHRNQYLYESAQ